jgi:acyl carrier protein
MDQQNSQLESRVREVLIKCFRLSPEAAHQDLRLGNPPQWDSIGHMELLVAIENEFGIRFKTHEISGLITVEAIISSIKAYNGSSAT